MTALQDQPARGGTAGTAHWRALLEARWRERLRELIELSVAFHEADEESPADHAVAARLALAETDDALRRLADGAFGWCQDCGAAIGAARLRDEPEVRYCDHCSGLMPAGARASSEFRGQECWQR